MNDPHNLTPGIAVLTSWAGDGPDGSMDLARQIAAERSADDVIDSLISVCAVLLRIREEERGITFYESLQDLGRIAQSGTDAGESDTDTA